MKATTGPTITNLGRAPFRGAVFVVSRPSVPALLSRSIGTRLSVVYGRIALSAPIPINRDTPRAIDGHPMSLDIRPKINRPGARALSWQEGSTLGTKQKASAEPLAAQEYMTPASLVEYLDGAVNEGTCRQWRYLGKGPKWHKVGNRVVYSRAEVDQWVAGEAA